MALACFAARFVGPPHAFEASAATLSPRPSLTRPTQAPRHDKSSGAVLCRIELLEKLLSCPRINPHRLDAQGRTFLFSTVDLARCNKGRCRFLLHQVAPLAQAAGLDISHQASWAGCRALGQAGWAWQQRACAVPESRAWLYYHRMHATCW